jgi:hypothetical protein
MPNVKTEFDVFVEGEKEICAGDVVTFEVRIEKLTVDDK